MTGPTCPACGVTVLAGYTRCPKCKAPLPAYGGGTRASLIAGGTAVDDSKFPVLPLVLVALAIVAGVAYFALRKGGDKKVAEPTIAASVAGPTLAGSGAPTTPKPTAQPDTPAANPAAADRRALDAAVGAFDASLKKQHLWSTVRSLGTRVDVRSAACDDPQMGPAFDAAIATLRAAGLTEARCLENSGRVVFTKPL